MAFTTSMSQRDIEQMIRHQRYEYEYRRMKEMHEYGFTQSGSGVTETAAKPETPKHLNPKLLLTKGA